MAITQQKQPYSTYAALVGAFGIGMSGLAGVASRRGRRPEELRPLDLAILSAATFKVARTVAHADVLSFLREPFVEGDAHEGDEKPVEDGGTRQTIGELLTCSRCLGMWAAAGVVGLHTVTPRSGRLLTWSLAASAANDFLQAGFSALTAKASELERRGG